MGEGNGGKGSRFWFEIKLPLGKKSELDQCNAIEQSRDQENNYRVNVMVPSAVDRLARKILVVEDNQVNQLVLVKYLEQAGYAIDTATNGKEAVNYFANDQYDLILMDCQMPVLDGYEAAKIIRALEGDQRHTLIIAVTAHAMKGDKELCLNAGMDDYITKPYKRATLLSKIDELLKRQVKLQGLNADTV